MQMIGGYVLSCDSLGGLYCTVTDHSHASHLLQNCGDKGAMTQEDIQKKVSEQANEEQMIAQANFQQNYTFDEANLIGLLTAKD